MIIGSFKSRATDVEAIIPAAYATSDFGAEAYDFLAYTAADPDAIGTDTGFVRGYLKLEPYRR